MEKFVSLKNIDFTYYTLDAETTVLKNISFDVKKGTFLSIVGPSGCGKSTLLSLISGLLPPTVGEVLINGQPVQGTSSKVGYMLQKDHLFQWRTIYQNVLLGLEVQKKLTPNSKNYALHLLHRYGLGDFKDYYPSQLSGGMRQRVALIRTLAIQPEILLLDEAFSALDYQTRLFVSDEIWKILKLEGKTAIMVTHDIAEAISMSDQILVLSQRPAKILNIHDIHLSCETPSPLCCREAPEFSYYFNTLWKELNIHA